MSHATAASDARVGGRRGWVKMGEDGLLARLRSGGGGGNSNGCDARYRGASVVIAGRRRDDM